MRNRLCWMACKQQYLAEIRMRVRKRRPDSQCLLVVWRCIFQPALASESESQAVVGDIVVGCYLNRVLKESLAVFPVTNLKHCEHEASRARQGRQAQDCRFGPRPHAPGD